MASVGVVRSALALDAARRTRQAEYHKARRDAKSPANQEAAIDGEDGPIVARWNVMSFPTVYLIDAKGVIRSKGEEDLDIVIQALVRQAEQK